MNESPREVIHRLVEVKLKKRKVGAKMVQALRAAERHGIVAGGMDASFSLFYKMADAGLIASTGPGAYSITDKGKQALKNKTYEV